MDGLIYDTYLPRDRWREFRASHVSTVQPLTSGYRARRARGESHPVYDFLFTYYQLSTTKLEQWHPGFGVSLECPFGSCAGDYFPAPRYRHVGDRVELSRESLRPRDVQQLRWIRTLCQTVLDRPARLTCYGLHEWAMVYRSEQVRHTVPLRLSPSEIAHTVESSTICCSHFDAFRFFTPAASPLNVIQPQPDTRLDLEQPGCIHANMDLYKWSSKLYPLISSSLIRECFLLALRAREVDMRASPYDLSRLGFEPICIETEDGRREYREAQLGITRDAQALRRTLLTAIDTVLRRLDEDKPFSCGGNA